MRQSLELPKLRPKLQIKKLNALIWKSRLLLRLPITTLLRLPTLKLPITTLLRSVITTLLRPLITTLLRLPIIIIIIIITELLHTLVVSTTLNRPHCKHAVFLHCPPPKLPTAIGNPNGLDHS